MMLTTHHKVFIAGIVIGLSLLGMVASTEGLHVAHTHRAAHHTKSVPTTVPYKPPCHLNIALQDALCTQGALNPVVDETNVNQTICNDVWVQGQMLDASTRKQLLAERMHAYGLDGQDPTNFELDHLIPIELGGATLSLENLWPEPIRTSPGAHEKDALEASVRKQVCTNRIPLGQARAAWDNWVLTWQQNRKPAYSSSTASHSDD